MDNNDRLNNSDHVKKMADMPVGKLIFTMSWPAIISMFIQAFYNVVDSFFVSLISEQALAAVTYICLLYTSRCLEETDFTLVTIESGKKVIELAKLSVYAGRSLSVFFAI